MTTASPLMAAQREGRAVLTEIESKRFLEAAGLPVVATRLAPTREAAVRFAREIGFPVAMKITSPEIVHKSDIGGVKLNLRSGAEVEAAYDAILRAARSHYPEARIEGVSLQPMARPGREIIIGMSKDPQFGPLLMFGIGGVMVELMKDVAFRLVPLSAADARAMVTEIKGYPLLRGYRGSEPADIPRLERLLLEVSALVESHPQIRELDLNPVLAYPDGALIVDARIILEVSGDKAAP